MRFMRRELARREQERREEREYFDPPWWAWLLLALSVGVWFLVPYLLLRLFTSL